MRELLGYKLECWVLTPESLMLNRKILHKKTKEIHTIIEIRGYDKDKSFSKFCFNKHTMVAVGKFGYRNWLKAEEFLLIEYNDDIIEVLYGDA